MKVPRMNLLLRIWLSTSVALTLIFLVTAWLLQRYALDASNRSLEEEVAASFQAYESLWRSRSESLASVASIVSSMPNVRDAFRTRHEATIRDVAGEIWDRVNESLRETAFLAVVSPEGDFTAPLGPQTGSPLPKAWPVVKRLRDRFPKQVSGFMPIDGHLFQLVITPVYVDSGSGRGLISILLTGFEVNHLVAQRLKEATGSDFLFAAPDRVYASTLNPRASGRLRALARPGTRPAMVNDGVTEYVSLATALTSLDGQPIGTLSIHRSFEAASQSLQQLRTRLALVWLAAVALGLAVSYALARRLVRPIEMLDAAAAEIARQNYDFRVPVEDSGELGRLAETFNSMCSSIQEARRELIRQERISTIGRMASSIVHDLRNPLAAIYGGAEMMVDTDLTPGQVKRLAANIYNASRRIQDMLQDLLQVTRGPAREREVCGIREMVEAAVDAAAPAAAERGVRITHAVDAGLSAPVERSRMERVLLNLISNAIEAMPGGGEIEITAWREGDTVRIEVADNGPGISPEIRGQLFQPFVTHGKKNGLGLGLALSRQSVLDHGGDIGAVNRPGGGALFVIRIPGVQPAAVS